MADNLTLQNPRILIIQKLYGHHLNQDTDLTFPKHRYRKFIKDVVKGAIERRELIQDLLDRELNDDINNNRTELMVKLIIKAAIYEFMFMHKTPVKVVIAEYLKASDYFLQDSQKSFLNAILDKAAKIIRSKNL